MFNDLITMDLTGLALAVGPDEDEDGDDYPGAPVARAAYAAAQARSAYPAAQPRE